MRQTSQTWQTLWAAGAALEAEVEIAGTVYTAMTAPVISRALSQSGMSVGNVVSASMQVAVADPAGTIPRAAEVRVRTRLNNGTTASEWLAAGTFFIARRRRDPVTGVLSLECYDALLKANAPMPEAEGLWQTEDGARITAGNGVFIRFESNYPASHAEMAAMIARTIGVELDARCSFETGAAYVIGAPEPGKTMRDALALIAAANGGNWIITPENRLRLVPLVSSAGAASAQVAVEVAAVLGSIGSRITGTVTGVRYDSDGAVVLGSEDGIVIDADVGAVIAADLYEKLPGMTYQSFTLERAVYDPAAELGDYVRAGVNGEVASVLFMETATLSALYTGNIGAPESGEMADEYPTMGAADKALTAAKVYAAREVAALDSSLDQESVFNRLTDNGAAQGIYLSDGQLYVSASYIRSGMLVLGGPNNGNGVLKIVDATGTEIGGWNNGGISVLKGNINLAYGSQIKVGFDANDTKYALFYANGMRLMLESGSEIYSSRITYGQNMPYPADTPFGALVLSYGDESTGKYETHLSPGRIFTGYITNYSTKTALLYELGQLLAYDYNTGYWFSVNTDTGELYWNGDLRVVTGDIKAQGGQFIGDLDGTAARATEADALKTARELYVDLGSARDPNNPVEFDGSANEALAVSGVLPVVNGGTGAAAVTGADGAQYNLGVRVMAVDGVTNSSGNLSLLLDATRYVVISVYLYSDNYFAIPSANITGSGSNWYATWYIRVMSVTTFSQVTNTAVTGYAAYIDLGAGGFKTPMT